MVQEGSREEKEKEFTVYFEGKITVTADSEDEATSTAYEMLRKAEPPIQFDITGSEED